MDKRLFDIVNNVNNGRNTMKKIVLLIAAVISFMTGVLAMQNNASTQQDRVAEKKAAFAGKTEEDLRQLLNQYMHENKQVKSRLNRILKEVAYDKEFQNLSADVMSGKKEDPLGTRLLKRLKDIVVSCIEGVLPPLIITGMVVTIAYFFVPQLPLVHLIRLVFDPKVSWMNSRKICGGVITLALGIPFVSSILRVVGKQIGKIPGAFTDAIADGIKGK